jgi:Low psii accumulation1 / Rep27
MANSQRSKSLKDTDPEKYARLLAESKAPYRGLRKFSYGTFGASGAIGALIFFTQILAGRDVEAALPNLAIQIAVIGLMIWLFRLEEKGKK